MDNCKTVLLAIDEATVEIQDKALAVVQRLLMAQGIRAPSNLGAPVLDRQAVDGCGCFAEVPPMPMGCAACGHAPYAHGCPDRPTGHEYAQPSAALLDIRLRARRTGDRSLPCFEPPAPVAQARAIPPVPAQRSAGQLPAEVSVQRCAEQAQAGEAGPMPDRRPGERTSIEVPPPAREIPPIPVQRRPEQAAVSASSSRRVRCRLRSTRPSRSTRTDASRLGYRRHLASRPRRRTTCALLAPSSYRPPGRYGVPLQILPRFIKQARPTLAASGRALDRIEVQPVRDGSSTNTEPTSPQSTIPGWRLILSDAGRLWASRERPFSPVAAHAGAERTVDGDSLEELRAETDRQETFAREAEEQALKEQAAREQAAQEQEVSKAPASAALAPETREREQAGRVIS